MPSRKESDDDPVVNEFDVYVTNNLIEKFYLLQFPARTRDRPYSEEYGNQPLAFRMKPNNGFIEMDVPLNTEINYDAKKASVWGNALSKSKADGSHGHGMAVGFSGTAPKSGRKPNAAASDEDDEGTKLEHQTLGGQIIHDERGKPNYMIGTFLTDKRELHLTDLDGIVQMRPQFHHIDARTQADRNKARREKEVGDPAVPKPQIVQVSYHNSYDPDQEEAATTKELLNTAYEEPWSQLEFHDEEEEESYASYEHHCFLPEDRQAIELVSTMNNDKYLDAISAPRLDHRGIPRTKPMTKKLKAQIELSDHEASDGEMAEDDAPTTQSVVA